MRDLKPLTDAEITELLGWVSACQSSYHIDSTPGHRFGGLGSHLQENRDSLVEYVNALIAARAQPAQAVPPGYVLVPVEPTPEIVAVMAVQEASGSINGTKTIGMAGAVAAYDAMLATAQGEKP